MIDYAQILSTNYGDKSWRLVGNDYDGLEWLDSSPKPTQAELDALWDKTKKQIDFVQNRQQAYPSIVDQLDKLYHDGYDGWKQMITEIKEQYPKPE